jgi:hypothetical protein
MNAVQTKNKAYTLSISGLIPKVPWPIPIKMIDEMVTYNVYPSNKASFCFSLFRNHNFSRDALSSIVKKGQFSALEAWIKVLRFWRAFSPVLNLQSGRIGSADMSTNSQGWTKSTGAFAFLSSGRKRDGGSLKKEEVIVAGILIILPSTLLRGNGGLYAAREES